MTSDTELHEREIEERAEIDVPDFQDQCHSAPNSEQNDEEFIDVETVSDAAGVDVGEQRSTEGRREDEEKELEIVEEDSSSDTESSGDEVEDRVASKADSEGEESSTSFSSSSSEGGKFLVRDMGLSEEESLEQEEELDALDAFPNPGSRVVDIAMRPIVELPRAYEWVSQTVLNTFSLYGREENMGFVIRKLNRKGMIFDVEGMGKTEHVATWPGALKFTMYDIVITDMNIRPPFTKFQQEALARLDIAPSQLHPNGWAFLRAFELVCLFLERNVSVDLFFHLFEVNRNNDGDEHRHVSLRAKRRNKVFRPYVESLQGRWSELFYNVVPVNEEAIQHVGKFGDRLVDGVVKNTVESTKFPIGWRKSHYNRPPGEYHIKTDWLLSNEDKETKTMLQFIEKQIPWNNPKHQGIPVKRLCHASTKAEVLRVLGKDSIFYS